MEIKKWYVDRSARLSGWKEAARHCQRRNVKSHERDLTPRAPFHPPSFLLWQHLLVFSLLLLGHLHSAWRLPPPERHLHRLQRRPPPPPRPAHHHHHHHLFHPQAASHHPHRKIIICHIHQYTVLSGLHLLSSFTIPLSFPPPFPPLLVFSPFLSLSLSPFSDFSLVPKRLDTTPVPTLSSFLPSFRVSYVHPSIPFIYSSPCSPLYSRFAFSNPTWGALVRFADASFSGVVLYCTLCLLLFLCWSIARRFPPSFRRGCGIGFANIRAYFALRPRSRKNMRRTVVCPGCNGWFTSTRDTFTLRSSLFCFFVKNYFAEKGCLKFIVIFIV